jgi:hypothetical protein
MANGWTAERKAKQSALIQTWKPWDKSTGARTPEGKAVSSQNAFKGGFRTMAREMSALLRDQKECMKLIK